MNIEFRPLSDALGAEVVGVDVVDDLSEQTVAEIRAGWLQHNILLFRNQEMSMEQQRAFTQRFGDLTSSPFSRSRWPDHPDVIVFSNIKVDGEYIGGPPGGASAEGWHSDFYYLKEPAGGSFFYAKEVPEKGGETGFANMTKAYEALPKNKKTALVDRKCTYNQANTLEVLRRNSGREPLTEQEKREIPDVVHPMVRTHPETGRKALFVGLRPTLACSVDGLKEQEGFEFLEELRSFATQPQFTYEHHWRPGDAMLWDNRCTVDRRPILTPPRSSKINGLACLSASNRHAEQQQCGGVRSVRWPDDCPGTLGSASRRCRP